MYTASSGLYISVGSPLYIIPSYRVPYRYWIYRLAAAIWVFDGLFRKIKNIIAARAVSRRVITAAYRIDPIFY